MQFVIIFMLDDSPSLGFRVRMEMPGVHKILALRNVEAKFVILGRHQVDRA